MDFLDLVKERYSVRSFKSDVITDDDMNKILEAGRVAPTACNLQPQRIYVIRDKEKLESLSKLAPIFGSPTVILMCADMDEVWQNRKEVYNTAEMDVSIVCTHMMLEAWNLGIGSTWVRMFNSEDVHKLFNLSSNIKPVCLLVMGYISEDSTPNKLHYNRKNNEEMVTYW